MTTTVREKAQETLHVPGLTAASRLGFVARAGFYLVLAGLVVQVILDNGGGKQADEHGALTLIAGNLLGDVLIALAAFGFLLLGIVRLVAAARDKDGSTGSRIVTALQGGFYVVLTAIPIEFLAGNGSTGSSQSQKHTTARLLGLPFGRELVFAVGLVVIGASLWQIRTGLTTDFAEGLDLPAGRPWVRRFAIWSGRAGIPARALVFLPIGVFLIIAAVQFSSSDSNGLDKELSAAARQPWGPYVLALVVLGLVVFACYSMVEAIWRDVGDDS